MEETTDNHFLMSHNYMIVNDKIIARESFLPYNTIEITEQIVAFNERYISSIDDGRICINVTITSSNDSNSLDENGSKLATNMLNYFKENDFYDYAAYIHGIKYFIIMFDAESIYEGYAISKFDSITGKCLGVKQFYAETEEEIDLYLQNNISTDGFNGYNSTDNEPVYLAYNLEKGKVDDQDVYKFIKEKTGGEIVSGFYQIEYESSLVKK